MIVNDIGPCYLSRKTPYSGQGKATGGDFKGFTNSDYVRLYSRQDPGIRLFTQCEYPTGNPIFPCTKANLPDDFLQPALRVREVCSVDVKDLHAIAFQFIVIMSWRLELTRTWGLYRLSLLGSHSRCKRTPFVPEILLSPPAPGGDPYKQHHSGNRQHSAQQEKVHPASLLHDNARTGIGECSR